MILLEKSCFFHVIYVLICLSGFQQAADGKPRISGPETIVAKFGQNISIECWANKPIIWFKFVNNTSFPKLISEESHTELFDLHTPDYIDWPDDLPEGAIEDNLAIMHIENAQYKDSGVYICTYDIDDFETMKKRIKKNKTHYFSTVEVDVKLMSPRIDVGESLVLNAGEDVNITCSGEKPVTWVLINNHTWGVQHTETHSNNQSMYYSVLQIENVNYTDVGYLICKFSHVPGNVYDDFIHEVDLNVVSTYLFVKDLKHLIVQLDTKDFAAQLGKEVIIPCKPTFPEVKISLVALDSSVEEKKIYYYPHSLKTGVLLIGNTASNNELICTAKYQNHTEEANFTLIYYNPVLSSVNLTVDGAWQVNSLERNSHIFDVIERDVVMINCSTHYKPNVAHIIWITPEHANSNKTHELSHLDLESKTVETRIISKVSVEKDSGFYSCYVTNNHVNSSGFPFALNVFSSDSSHLEMKAQNSNVSLPKSAKFPEQLKWIIFFRAYPALYLNWTINGETKIIYKIEHDQVDHYKPMIKRKEQYEIKVNWPEGEITLQIHSPTIRDTGTYVLSAEVPDYPILKQNITLKFFKEGLPQLVTTVLHPSTQLISSGSNISFECSSFGYPFPELKVLFKSCNSSRNCRSSEFVDIETKQFNEEKLQDLESNSEITGKKIVKWTGVAKVQGFYYCTAVNVHGSNNSTMGKLVISDSGFSDSDFLQIEVNKNGESFLASPEVRLIDGDDVILNCRGNTFMTSFPLVWTVRQGENSSILFGNKNTQFRKGNITVYDNQTEYSFNAYIEAKATKKMDGVTLTCSEPSPNSFEKSINISVIDSERPQWTSEPLNKRHYVMNRKEKLNLQCAGVGTPEPTVTWFKDYEKIETNEKDRRISFTNGNLSFEFLFSEDAGEYLCRIENRVGSIEDFITLEIEDPDAASQRYLFAAVGVIAALFAIIVLILSIKVYKDRKADRSLKLEIQKRFIEGNPESLNPDLDLGEQADLLPYDNKFEFPRGRVTIENLLGSGAFGNVFKATAIDLVSGASKTTVAVKMMKSPSNHAQMKTLVSELKIMIHIGRHINIVNLLGACSKDMASKGELLLLVEYCRHGNILEYMRRHKGEFLNQINMNDKIDPSSKYIRRRTYSNSRNSHRPTYAQLDLQRSSTYIPNNCGTSNGSSGNSGNSGSIRRSVVDSSPFGSAERRRIKSGGSGNDFVFNTDMTIASIENSADNYISENILEQKGSLCSQDLLHWSYQIANGMFYLSEKKVIHGDLAARNILLADKNVVKISDFGLSKNIYKQENYKKKSECPLPVKWLALEALQDSIFSTHSDVWSYGIVLWEIFSLGSNPYAGVEVDAEFVNKLENGLRLSHPQYATSELYQIMMRCWQKNPNDRPSFRYLEQILGGMLGEAEKQMYITLNAHYEENNYVSEHLQFLHTPTYDSRVRMFFTEKDDDGYEKALSSPTPGNEHVEEEVAMRFDNAEGPFRLYPVPKRKTILNGSVEECETLLDDTTPSEYLIMKTPLSTENNFNFETIPLQELSNVTYANLGHLNSFNISNAQRKSSHSVDSPKDLSDDSETGKEERKFVFNDISPTESDSVFLTDDVNDKRYGALTSFQPKHSGSSSDPQNHITPYHKKHDSGLYSPDTIQNNPIYLQKSFFFPEENVFKNNESIEIDVHNNKNKTEQKQRNPSDSSSGFGSLDDHSNSLEKYKSEKFGNIFEDSIIENQSDILEYA